MRFLRAIAILLVLSACVGASDTVPVTSGPHGTITVELNPISPVPAFAPGIVQPEPECTVMGGGSDCIKRVLLKA